MNFKSTTDSLMKKCADVSCSSSTHILILSRTEKKVGLVTR